MRTRSKARRLQQQQQQQVPPNLVETPKDQDGVSKNYGRIALGSHRGIRGRNLLAKWKSTPYFELIVDNHSMMKKEETKIPERRIKDVPVVRNFPEVFLEDLPRLPPTCQVEFHIEIIPEVAPVSRTPYRLAPAEMKELAEQLKEL
ncbi:hypothetical protein Tco_1501882 [Tanacetum coccineum]